MRRGARGARRQRVAGASAGAEIEEAGPIRGQGPGRHGGFAAGPGAVPGLGGEVSATYAYRDAGGRLLYEVVRRVPKGFACRRAGRRRRVDLEHERCGVGAVPVARAGGGGEAGAGGVRGGVREGRGRIAGLRARGDDERGRRRPLAGGARRGAARRAGGGDPRQRRGGAGARRGDAAVAGRGGGGGAVPGAAQSWRRRGTCRTGSRRGRRRGGRAKGSARSCCGWPRRRRRGRRRRRWWRRPEVRLPGRWRRPVRRRCAPRRMAEVAP